MLDVRNKYLWIWLAWGMVGLVLEVYTMCNKKTGDTFSELVWALLRRGPLITWLFAGLLGFLVVHLLKEGRWK